MATTNVEADSALANLPPCFAPMPAVMRVLSQFDRSKLEGFITVAIGLLDVVDGDPDVEANGDEDDGSCGEDEAGDHLGLYGMGPGCPIADPGEHSIPERHGKQPELKQSPRPEDDEEDDPQGEVTDDEPAFDKQSRSIANLWGSGGPGCTISDPDYGIEDQCEGTAGLDC